MHASCAKLISTLLEDSVEIAGRDFSLRLNLHAWPAVLKIARQHGWVQPPQMNCLSAAQASGLAEALRQALDDIPDEPILEARAELFPTDPGYGLGKAVTPPEVFSGAQPKQWLSHLIQLLNSGTVNIK